jgi:hypothetical protein
MKSYLLLGLLIVPVFVSATAHAQTSPGTPPAALLARLPKDDKGRVIGGPLVPYLNYTTTLVTGKACPRVNTWAWQVVKPDAPLRPYGVVSDSCVIQNAVDDFVRTEFADPAVNTPQTMPSIAPLYVSDPAIRDGLQPALRDSLLKNYRDGRTPYYQCDRPRYKLLDVSPRTPLLSDNAGRVRGDALQLTVFVVSDGVKPYRCSLLSYKDNALVTTLTKTEAQLKAKQRVLKIGMVWNAEKRRWVVYDFGSAEVDAFYASARALWDAASYKP